MEYFSGLTILKPAVGIQKNRAKKAIVNKTLRIIR